MGQTPVVIAVYLVLTLALGGQWIAAKVGVAGAHPLELSAMRFVIASLVLVSACAVSRATGGNDGSLAADSLRTADVAGRRTGIHTCFAPRSVPECTGCQVRRGSSDVPLDAGSSGEGTTWQEL